ncbi:MAG TPA: hypothetical protein VJY63_08955 [Marinospirillum sp.]|uniref:hypothetical protein n=1 Tax=Marinospirillum sp. TaxID=2183934 RepID=UPI002B4A9DB6|nr:hypothetical protein [Marinospirillum sp.]HKM16030.1 hypothetical protein [Marinospirillum sp.]
MTIHITDTQYLQQQIGTLVGKTALVDKSNNADAFSKTLQQVQQIQAKAATETVSTTTADVNTDALKQLDESSTNAIDEFLAWMQMSDAEKVRDRILKSMGLTEEDLKSMEYDEREKIEAIIAQKIKEETEVKIKKQLAGDTVKQGYK